MLVCEVLGVIDTKLRTGSWIFMPAAPHPMAMAPTIRGVTFRIGGVADGGLRGMDAVNVAFGWGGI